MITTIGIGMTTKKNKTNVINSVKVIITPWQKGFTCGIIMDSQSKMTTEEYELCSTIAKAKVTPGTPAARSASRGLAPTLKNGLETRSANARQRMRGRSGGVGAEVTEQEKLSLATPPNNPPAKSSCLLTFR